MESSHELIIQKKLEILSPKQLIAVIRRLATHIDEETVDSVITHISQENTALGLKLDNNKRASSDEILIGQPSKKKIRISRPFDITKYRQRQIAFQVQYEGGTYSGFAYQDAEDTVEKNLFDAFVKLRLIDSRQTCNYSRCGRTDKGVSAFGQVVSMTVRSAFPLTLPDDQLPKHPNDTIAITDSNGKLVTVKELDYVGLLNKVLPEQIRILGWCEVTESFSARFSASYRMYRYFFTRKTLNIDAMKQAAQYLIGSHDFRNFCKVDVENISNFTREIYSVEIRQCTQSWYEAKRNQSTDVETVDDTDNTEIYVFEIKGIAFLWHMVRCIMAVLFLVGEEKEEPEIINDLLDVDKNPGKPQYMIASELPLVLHECGFDNLSMKWQSKSLWSLTCHFRDIMDRYLIAAVRAKNSLDALSTLTVRRSDVSDLIKDILSDDPEKFIDSDSDGSKIQSHTHNVDSTDMTWDDAIRLFRRLGIKIGDNSSYIKLLERRRHDDYDTKCRKLTGQKKERYERHVTLRTASAHNDNSFFQTMRKQGSK